MKTIINNNNSNNKNNCNNEISLSNVSSEI